MTKQKNNQNNRDILSIRFSGPHLNTRGIPIYELSQSLMAVQRIINKTHLFDMLGTHGIEKKVVLPAYERQEIALQISEHRKGSDIYGFIPFIASRQSNQLLNRLVKKAIDAIGFYAYQTIPSQNPSNNQEIVGEGTFIKEWNNSEKRVDLKNLLADHFNKSELKELCYDLSIEYENLDGEKRIEKVMAIISYMERRNRVDELIQYCIKKRPSVSWTQGNKILQPNNISNRLLAGYIYNEVSELNRRIDNIGDIDSIELSSSMLSGHISYLFNSDTKAFMKQLEKDPLLGATQSIKGVITTLYLTTVSVGLVEDISRNKLKILLKPNDLKNIRQHPEKHPHVIIQGRPVYRFGTENLQFTAMAADKISILDNRK